MAQRTVQAGYITRSAVQLHEHGMTYNEIAKLYNVNPRTLRKLRTGETSGRVIFQRETKRAREGTHVERFQVRVRVNGKWASVMLSTRTGGNRPIFAKTRDAIRIQSNLQDAQVQQAIQAAIERQKASPIFAQINDVKTFSETLDEDNTDVRYVSTHGVSELLAGIP